MNSKNKLGFSRILNFVPEGVPYFVDDEETKTIRVQDVDSIQCCEPLKFSFRKNLRIIEFDHVYMLPARPCTNQM